jgi:hypothetical protein
MIDVLTSWVKYVSQQALRNLYLNMLNECLYG